jgi:DNA-binding GntR family transcriptional regulator
MPRSSAWAAGIMRDRIVSVDWQAGRKILAPEELAEILRVDPRTIFRAISHLQEAGYVRVVPGKGTYVLRPDDWPGQRGASRTR